MLASTRWQRLAVLPITLFVAFALTTVTSGSASAGTGTAQSVGTHVGATLKTSTAAQRHEAQRQSRLRAIQVAIRVAAQQRGDRYRYGGTGPSSFDCSGLTQYVFKRAGISLPRTASSQYAHLRHIPKAHLQKGDLVYFYSGSHVYHAAIYWGTSNGHRLVFHASRPGTPVGVSRIWTSQYHAATTRIHR